MFALLLGLLHSGQKLSSPICRTAFLQMLQASYTANSTEFILLLILTVPFPWIRSPVKNLARLGFPGFWPSLPGKCGLASLATAKFSWQPWPQKSGFLGHVSSKARPSWRLGQQKNYNNNNNLASLATKTLARISWIFWH